MTVPVLTTPRLLLREHRLEDFPDISRLWADPVVTRHIGGRPQTEEEAWAKLHRLVGHWALLGFGYWVVCERESGRFVGQVGLANFKRDLDPSFGDAPEAGWVLAPAFHGKGYGAEAVQAALAWGDARFGPVRMVCLIHPDNAASLRLAARCGFREYARTAFKGDPTVLLERPASS